MIGAKMNTLNDTTGEPEQDANSALTELDKGLRSGKVGEQCEAIVRFPRLFEKYPFPILINSSFLKLADVFRMGNNFLRLWVLRVCQQSEKHMDKILNVDEFLRRVYSVLHSNDPVARALALRTLGAVAGIIPERQNVHHAIRRGLDSHDNVEVDAAIYATTRFAAHSNAFAVAMCNKLSDMVECESTAVDRRVKLVRAMRTVHGGAVRAHGVLNLLKSLLEKYPSSSFVRAAITALTHIATDTVVHVPDQVELLLSIATEDPRLLVRRAALCGLKQLARHASLWPAHSIDQLARAPHLYSQKEHAMLCLQVMQMLVECPAICAAAGSEQHDSALRQYCSEAAFSSDLNQAALACRVLTAILVHCYEESLPVDGSDLMLALESLVIATGVDEGPASLKPLKIALQCLVSVSGAAPALHAARSGRAVVGALRGAAWRGAGAGAGVRRGAALLQALCGLPRAALLPRHIAHNILTDMLREDCIANPADDGTALVLACTALLQERAIKAFSCTINPSWADNLVQTLTEADGWVRYRVARAALRYGHHRLASLLLTRLTTEAESEATQRWLSALQRAAAADHTLEQEGISGLEAAAAAWEVAAWRARAATAGTGGGGGGCGAGCAGCGACVPLAAGWLRARAAALAALARAAPAARALCAQPPPAVAQSTRDPAAAAGAAAPSLRSAARALLEAANNFRSLASTAFHADDSTLRHLQISEHTYTQFAHFLERITSPQQERPEICSTEWKANTLEEKIALAPSEAIARIASKLFDNPTTGPGITHRHAEAVLAAAGACGGGRVWPRAVCAARGCGAGARLSVCDHPPPLPLHHRLALKLEGVLLHRAASQRAGRRKRQKARKVKGVQITVTATPHPRTNEKTVEPPAAPPVLKAVQTVAPVRDFFSAQQLVAVPAPGLYCVAVDAALVDQRGQLWNTGPRTTILVKAHEEQTNKGSAQTTRGRF